MRTFVSILRDSFREAVDGFVIYIMLAISVLTIIVVACIGYQPADAEVQLTKSIKGFAVFIPDKGESKAISAVPGVQYEATSIKVNGKDVLFDLEVTSKLDPGILKAGFPEPFRTAVAGWMKKPYKSEKRKIPPGVLRGGRAGGDTSSDATLKELEIALAPEVSAEEAAAITDDQMIEFIKSQFAAHYGCTDVKVRRRSIPETGKYIFEIEAINLRGSRGWGHSLSFLHWSLGSSGDTPLGLVVYVIEDVLVNGIGGAVLLLISVILTSFFIPNMLRKGTLDLVVSKPVGKVQYLIYKYLGGLIFITIVSSITIGGVWFVIGIRSGMWDPRFLITIPALVLSFALLYSFSTLIAVLTRSAIASMLLTIAFTFGLWLVGYIKKQLDVAKAMGEGDLEGVSSVFDIFNNVLPRYKDLDKLTSKVTSEGTYTPILLRFQDMIIEPPSYVGVLGITFAYIGGFLALASWRHATRDG